MKLSSFCNVQSHIEHGRRIISFSLGPSHLAALRGKDSPVSHQVNVLPWLKFLMPLLLPNHSQYGLWTGVRIPKEHLNPFSLGLTAGTGCVWSDKAEKTLCLSSIHGQLIGFFPGCWTHPMETLLVGAFPPSRSATFSSSICWCKEAHRASISLRCQQKY